MKKYKYFSFSELACKCRKCDSTGEEMDDNFMKYLHRIRAACRFPFIITSAYRCPQHNADVSKGRFYGPHTLGQAVDIKVDRKKAFVLLKWVYYCDNMTGIGIQQKGESRFIHLDTVLFNKRIPRPTIWSY